MFLIFSDPVKGPERRLMSMSDDEADLDTVLFMEHLRKDSDDLFSIRINNVPLEDAILIAIFDALKTTTKIKHLCLAGVGMKDELGLVSFFFSCTEINYGLLVTNNLTK